MIGIYKGMFFGWLFALIDADPMKQTEEAGSYESDSGASTSSSPPPSPISPTQHRNIYNHTQQLLPRNFTSVSPQPLLPLPLQHASPPLLPLPRQPTTLIGKTPLPASILGERRAPLLRDGNHPPMGEMNSALIAKSEEVMGHHPRQPHPPSGHAHPPVYIPEDVVLPPEVELRESCIQEAGLGVFSLDDIPHGRKFGPFMGVERTVVTDTQYAWEVSGCIPWCQVCCYFVISMFCLSNNGLM